MIKRNIIFIIIITIITVITSLPKVVSAATPSPTPNKVSSPSATTIIDKLKQIEILKEKIATKVAQLREKEKGAISGTIKSIDGNKITLTTRGGQSTISYSEDTVAFTMTEGKKSDPQDATFAKKLKTGDTLAAFGYYDSSRTTLAVKYIYLVTSPLHFLGKIIDTDKSNYTISVKEPQGTTTVDVETYSKIYTYNKKTGLTRGGFSKLAENNNVHIFATPNPKEEGRVSALKIISLSFEQIPSTPSATPTQLTKETTPSATPTKK